MVSGEATGEDLLNQKGLCHFRLIVSDFTISENEIWFSSQTHTPSPTVAIERESNIQQSLCEAFEITNFEHEKVRPINLKS